MRATGGGKLACGGHTLTTLSRGCLRTHGHEPSGGLFFHSRNEHSGPKLASDNRGGTEKRGNPTLKPVLTFFESREHQMKFESVNIPVPVSPVID